MSKPRVRKASYCFQCGTAINGRADKIYCSQSCQNTHFKEVKEEFIYLSECLNSGTTRNCIVAEGILGQEFSKVEISKRALFKHNFDLFSFDKIIWTKGKKKYQIGHFLFWIRNNGNVVIKRIKKTRVNNLKVYRRWDGEFLWRFGEFIGLVERNQIALEKGELIMAIPFDCKAYKKNLHPHFSHNQNST